MISVPAFDKYQLTTIINHNVIVYEDNRITKTVTLNKFPVVQELINISITGIDIKQPKKVIYYV